MHPDTLNLLPALVVKLCSSTGVITVRVVPLPSLPLHRLAVRVLNQNSLLQHHRNAASSRVAPARGSFRAALLYRRVSADVRRRQLPHGPVRAPEPQRGHCRGGRDAAGGADGAVERGGLEGERADDRRGPD